MGAALPHVRPASYNRNTVQGHSRLMAGDGSSTTSEEHRRAQGLSHSFGQSVAHTPYLRQPFQQGHQIQGLSMDYSSGSIAYLPPQNFVHPYSQPLQHLQPQQPVLYGRVGAAYHPVQQHLTIPTYNDPPGVIFNQNQGYLTPLNAPSAAAGFPETTLLQTHSAGRSSLELLRRATMD